MIYEIDLESFMILLILYARLKIVYLGFSFNFQSIECLDVFIVVHNLSSIVQFHVYELWFLMEVVLDSKFEVKVSYFFFKILNLAEGMEMRLYMILETMLSCL